MPRPECPAGAHAGASADRRAAIWDSLEFVEVELEGTAEGNGEAKPLDRTAGAIKREVRDASDIDFSSTYSLSGP